ncbi:MAG: aconitase X, partial [Anaerolineales bacterium]
MEIVVGLGKIYHASKLIPIASAQIAGVSYDNLGDAGLQFLESLAQDGTRCRVPATLNPAGMDLRNWKALGISDEFAQHQLQVINAYQNLGVELTCTCTPYLIGNVPKIKEHIAWSESSAVVYANSVLGAYTNREGGPSALAAALTGKTAYYGFHLDENRIPSIGIEIDFHFSRGNLNTHLFGALGKLIGEIVNKEGKKEIPMIQGLQDATMEELKSFSASVATYGGLALFHALGVTPEADSLPKPQKWITITEKDFQQALEQLQNFSEKEIDFISLGCPHLSLNEIKFIAEQIKGKFVQVEFWLTTARKTKELADKIGYTQIIEESGIKFAVDTCCVVAPIQNRFHAMLTDSAKACFYAKSKNNLDSNLLSIEQLLEIATKKRGKNP